MPAEPRDVRTGSRLREDARTRTAVPVTDVLETDAAFVIVVDMPGVAPDRLDVTAEADALMIRGRVAPTPQPPRHREFELTDYAQTFMLTEDLDPSLIQASLKDGVLRITIPKSPTVQPRRIQIHTE